MLAIALFGACAHWARADTIAYSTNDLNGTQNWGGNLGLDFNVVSPILVTAVGVYDSGADGILPPPIDVGIFQRLPGGDPNADFNGVLIPGTFAAIVGNADPLIAGYRFVTLSTPVVLGVGAYTIDAVGFGAPNPNGNVTLPPFTVNANSGGGLIQFVGTGRYDGNPTFDYPTLSSADQSYPGIGPEPFAGGSFQFRAASVPLPSSISCGLVLLGLVAMFKMQTRRAGA